MSDQLYEQISAFADGELPENETELLLKRLEREPELRAALVRYHAIGANLRETATRAGSRSFVTRVSAAIAAESKHAAVARTQTPRWLRPLAGLAVAATVAAVAILGVQWVQLPAEAPLVADATPLNTVPPLVIGDPQVAAPQPSYTVPVPTSDTPIVSAARLTNYVVAHSQYSSALGRRNVLSGIIAEDPTPLDESGKPLEGAEPAPARADQP